MHLNFRAPIIGVLFFLPSLLSSQEMYDQPWRWVHFTMESGLPSDHILQIVEAADSTVWISTTTGLAWYDGYEWNAIDSTKGIPPGTPENLHLGLRDSILITVNTQLYSGTRKGFRRMPFTNGLLYSSDALLVPRRDGFSLYRNGSMEAFTASFPMHTNTRMASTFLRTRSGRIWASVGGTFYCLNKNSWEAKITLPLSTLSVRAFSENKYGEGVFALTGYPPLFEWDRTMQATPNPREAGMLASALDVDSRGEVIVVLQSGEARIRRRGGWSTLSYFQNSIRNVTVILFRDNGDLWVGTEHGLYLYRSSSTRWRYFTYPSPDQRNYVNEILVARDSTLWLATGGGLEHVERDRRTTTFDSIGSQYLFATTGLAQDNNGSIWISSGGGFTGSYMWNGSEWKHFTVGSPASTIYFHKIRKDRNGNLWFLGLRDTSNPAHPEPGAYRYVDGKFIPWGVAEGLPSGRVYSFGEGRDGSLWFGTLHGLARWKDSHWTYWTTANGLRGDKVFALFIDHTNRIWFSDGVYGLETIDEHDNLSYFAFGDGLISNNVREILADDEGTIWISTERGLSCYRNGTWSNFDYHNGLPNPFIWPIWIQEEKVYLGTIGSGLAILDLAEAHVPMPKVHIDRLFIEEDRALVRVRVFSYWGTDSPEDIQVRFRLDDQRWSPWKNDREATLENLTPGEHSFELQAKNSFGNINEAIRPTSFTVPRPWYRHPLYLTPLALLLFGTIMLTGALILRKRKHSADVHKSELRFRRLTEATFEGIIIHDNGTILELNRSALEMFGYTYDEVTNRSILDFISPESRETVSGNASNNSVEQYEAVGLKKDGSKIVLEIIGRPIPFNNKTVRVDAIRNITERKHAERKLLDYQEQLRLLALQLSTTEERERRQMATYLHDYIGHMLALCKIKLGEMRNSAAQNKIAEVEKLLDETINNSRSLTFELSPPVLSSFSLEDSIEWLVENFQETHNLLISYEKETLPGHLPDDLRSFLYHTVRELLVNIVKHAKANSAEVFLKQVHGTIEVRVHDDGCGFDPDSAAPKMKQVTGFGLFSIKERVAHYGGTVVIQSQAEAGTRVCLAVPFSSIESGQPQE